MFDPYATRFYFNDFDTLYVRLNLFNYVLALFRAKFACNLAIRYLVFRWELCKGNVCESMKKSQEVCNSRESRDWIWRLTSHQNGTREKHAGGVEGSQQLEHNSWSTTGQNFQSGQAISSRLILVASSSCQNALFVENWPFAFLIHPIINTLIPTKCRELPERILREKP